MNTPSLLELHAMELLNAPRDWRAYRFEHRLLTTYIEGAVAPVITRGKRKGQRDWKKKGKSSSIEYSHADHDVWIAAWQERTGLCARCEGRGEVFRRWSKETGTEFRLCPQCNGQPFVRLEVKS
jgi:hypothetical protein